jgi:glucokinase
LTKQKDWNIFSMEQWLIGFDIGGTKCAVLTADVGETIHILDKKRFDTRAEKGFDSTWAELMATLSAAFEASDRPVDAIGISCGGPLNSRKGIIQSPPNLPGWDEVPIVAYLQEKLGIPAFVQNDANACALAEWRFGAGRGCKNMVFLTCGTGLGAGLILDGRLYSGTNDMAGEIGHVRAEKDGPVGYGKRGSYEGFCSGGGIFQLTGGVSARDAVMRADTGDAAMLAALHKSAEQMGACFALLIDLLNPERIVVGSIFARAERHFRDVMQRVIDAEALELSRSVCRVVPAELGDTIGDHAALSVGIDGLARMRGY